MLRMEPVASVSFLVVSFHKFLSIFGWTLRRCNAAISVTLHFFLSTSICLFFFLFFDDFGTWFNRMKLALPLLANLRSLATSLYPHSSSPTSLIGLKLRFLRDHVKYSSLVSSLSPDMNSCSTIVANCSYPVNTTSSSAGTSSSASCWL